MQVLKFGGSSVANAVNIRKVENIVDAAIARGKVILVLSAIKGCTDTLIEIGAKAAAGDKSYKEVLEALCQRHIDVIHNLLPDSEWADAEADCGSIFKEVEATALHPALPDSIQTYGELLSTRIVTRKFASEGVKVKWLDSRQLVRKGNMELTYANIAAAVEAEPDVDLFLAPGFIATDDEGRYTTLGRGGSDFTAAIYAAACKADTLEIWTDVPGIMTCNPKVVPSAHTISHISYKAAFDMANLGAKVLYAPTVQPAMDANIAINILNTFEPDANGTVIEGNPPRSKSDVLGIANMPEEAAGYEKISLIGSDLLNVEAAKRKIAKALAKAGIEFSNARSEGTNVFITVEEADSRDTMLALHREFFETAQHAGLDVYIAGYGAVGSCLVDIISSNRTRIADRTGIYLNLVGISNNKKFVINRDGISAEHIGTLLASGHSAVGGAFVDAIEGDYLRRSVFVDCTDSDTLGARYEDLFKKGIRVVSCNRRAFTVPFAQYERMKNAAKENGVTLRYGTTVGAALPVLESVSSSANSSDEILSIEAAVSCTLNYIISNYDGTNGDNFATLLKRAHEEGLTEQDPRLDLGGRDALRKLLIIAREAGVPLEESDVEITPALGPEFFDCSIDEFYRKLYEYEPTFVEREHQLDEVNHRQRFVATLQRDPSRHLGYRASISLQEVDEESPFFRLRGTENVIAIKSRYISSPLVIRGDGEGARLAASGVINDILMQ